MHVEYPQTTKPAKFQKTKQWIRTHQLSIALIGGAVVITGIFLSALLLIQPDTIETNTPPVVKKPTPAEKFYSKLTGIEVADEATVKQPVTAVMIENSPDARPQSGLKKAGVVYEAVAEGGITRFIALYQQEKPALIGPVRSLRIYYLDWAAPYQASIAHVGGSYNALEEVRNGSHRDLDHFFNPDAYWRSSDRSAPHNVYTSSENLDQLNTSKGYTSSIFESFPRTDGKPVDEPSATSISVNFSSTLYNTNYTYDTTSNTYTRFLAGEPHADREEGQLTPSVIVVLKVTAQSRGGSDGYEDIITDGEGQAYIFQNGMAQEVTWKKDGRMSPLRLVDTEGKSVALNRGQTWVGAITERGNVSWQ